MRRITTRYASRTFFLIDPQKTAEPTPIGSTEFGDDTVDEARAVLSMICSLFLEQRSHGSWDYLHSR